MNYPIVPSNHGAQPSFPSDPIDGKVGMLSQLALLLNDLTTQLDPHFKRIRPCRGQGS